MGERLEMMVKGGDDGLRAGDKVGVTGRGGE